MFDLTEEFLQEVGIANMPEPARGSLVSGIKKMIQDRVNIKLADSLTDEKIDELERISSSLDDAKWWLGENVARYADSAEYMQFTQQVTDGDPVQLFAQTKWFQVNVPGMAVVLQDTLDEVKGELKTISGAPA